MSKDRRLRRAVREAEQQRVLAARARAQARRLRLRARWRRASLYDLRRRRTGRLAVRRTRGERALITVVVVVLLYLIWAVVPSSALSVALTLLLLLGLPVFLVVAFDRRSS